MRKEDREQKREEERKWGRKGKEVSPHVSISESINQSKHICIAPYVANEPEAHNGRDYRLSVHVYYRQHQTVQFLSYDCVLRSSADLRLSFRT